MGIQDGGWKYDWRPRYESAGDVELGRLLLTLEQIHRESQMGRDYRNFRVVSVYRDSTGANLWVAVYTYEAYVTVS